MSNTKEERIDSLLRKTWSALERESEILQEQDSKVDLSCIESHIKDLFQEMSLLSKDEAFKYESDLRALHTQMNIFRKQIIERRDNVRKKIDELNQANKARKAYTNTENKSNNS